MTKSKKKETFDGSDVCVCLHTALRKSCDSHITSAAYNLIHMIRVEPEKFNAWRIYGDIVAQLMSKGEKPLPAAKKAIELTDDAFYKEVEKARPAEGRPPEGSTAALHALLCTLRCFDANDWAGFVSYLE